MRLRRPPGRPGDAPEPRATPRTSGPLDDCALGWATFVAGEIEGTAQVVNISLSGALVAWASHRLEEGTKVELFFTEPGTGRRLRALGRVVRTTRSGFAVEFSRLERKLRALALYAVRKEAPER